MRTFLAACGALALAALSPLPAVAQTWAESVWTQLQDQYMTAMAEGYESETFVIGKLYEGERVTWSLQLHEGNYQIRAACDGDCMDVDLRFFEDGMEIASDTATDYAPILNVDVYMDGAYEIEVEMYECSAEPCYYGVGVFHVSGGESI